MSSLAAAPGAVPDRDAAASAASGRALAATLAAALAARTRESFTALLSPDVRWGGLRRGEGNECTNRDPAGDHYAGLLEEVLILALADPRPTDPALVSGATADLEAFDARMLVRSPDLRDHPPEVVVRLTLSGGLISEICLLDEPGQRAETETVTGPPLTGTSSL